MLKTDGSVEFVVHVTLTEPSDWTFVVLRVRLKEETKGRTRARMLSLANIFKS